MQLAVVAHIRHMYTTYDKLLRQIPWQAARSLVETETLRKLAEWRGENDEKPDALEEIIREVIVISEDEDGDNQDTKPDGLDPTSRKTRLHGRNSMEITTEDTSVQPVHLQQVDFSQKEDIHAETPKPEDGDRRGFLGHGQYFVNSQDLEKRQRYEAKREHAWQEARTLNRQAPVQTSLPASHHDQSVIYGGPPSLQPRRDPLISAANVGTDRDRLPQARTRGYERDDNASFVDSSPRKLAHPRSAQTEVSHHMTPT